MGKVVSFECEWFCFFNHINKLTGTTTTTTIYI